jgi:Alpha/beta hydrolase domain containing 18
MSWLEQKIRRYEHARWTIDDNRRVFPFEWGLEHIGGRYNEPDPRAFLDAWVEETLRSSDAWFATEAAIDHVLHQPENGSSGGQVLTFTSQIVSPWPKNNLVHARLFRAAASGPAVVLLPNWNAKWDGQVNLCRWLAKVGISVLRLSLPYHDRRVAPGHERADQLVGSNVGLTLQAMRQAVTDTRRCLRWLEMQGYGPLGIVGTSIGSAIGSITMAHDQTARAGAFMHVSTYFADVVRTGMTTAHVWEGLRAKVTEDELRCYWTPISPVPYMDRLRGTGQRMLMISGRYDPTFWYEFTEEMFESLRQKGIDLETLTLPCGHYSLELAPFAISAGLRLALFLFESLG